MNYFSYAQVPYDMLFDVGVERKNFLSTPNFDAKRSFCEEFADGLGDGEIICL